MSAYFCFICHSTGNIDTNGEIRNRYKEIVGVKLHPDAQLCYICRHIVNKLWMFRSMCIKRSIEYPVFLSETNGLHLTISDLQIHILCPEDGCGNDINILYQSDESNHNQFDAMISTNAINDYDNNDLNLDSKEPQNYSDFNGTSSQQGFCEEDSHGHSEQNHYFINHHFINDETCTKDVTKYDEYKILTHPMIDGHTQLDVEAKLFKPEVDSNNIKIKKHKSKKHYKKIILNIAEQKAELETRRKEKKYMEAEFKCYSCGIGFLLKDSYQAHMMRHEESNGEYRCSICKLRFALPGLLRVHTAGHAERFRCGKCNIVIRGRARKTHAKVCFPQTQEESVSCHLCARLFKTASGLQQHLKRFHLSKTSNRMYPCNVCGKSYSNQAAIRTHMITHINRKFPCDQCSATFSSPYTLTWHKKKHGTDAEPKQFYCETCRTAFDTKKNLLAHKRNTLIHQFKLFECPICSKTCPNQRSLSLHIQAVHSTGKDFVCAHCPARYTNRKSLVRHVGTHNGKGRPKVSICHLCGKSFKKLKRHLRNVCNKVKVAEQEQLASQEIYNF